MKQAPDRSTFEGRGPGALEPGPLGIEVHPSPGHNLERFFARWREERAGRYAAPERRGRRHNRCAAVTIVHNERVFLPIWLRYYSRFFPPEDLYVLDNGSTDGSTSRDGFVRVPVSHDMVDHDWMVRTVGDFQRDLLDRYDVVLTTDSDEIVAPDPAWGDLGDYMARFDEEFVNCLGYEVLHLRDREPPLDPRQGVLEQRGYWFANGAYDKPAIASEPLAWVPGFHSRADGRFNWDPDLRLIHLHRMDYATCQARHRLRRARAWNERDLSTGMAKHNRIADDGEFERWFYTDSCFENHDIHIVLEPIPAAWKGVV